MTLEVKLIRLWNHFNRWVFREIGTHLFYPNLAEATSCLGCRGVVTPSADPHKSELSHHRTIVRTVLGPDDPVVPQVLEIDMGFNQSSAKP